MSKIFLDGLLKGNIWAPMKNQTQNWKTKKKCTKLSVFNRINKYEVPDKKNFFFT